MNTLRKRGKVATALQGGGGRWGGAGTWEQQDVGQVLWHRHRCRYGGWSHCCVGGSRGVRFVRGKRAHLTLLPRPPMRPVQRPFT